ncbi:hypothetical protein [Aeromicrobium sp.]|uniref:hypothetical protein n=1 Tax=Aeromicrobium sp. TaxID=1871063 RepID=UPI001997E12B|nr:hypothetical protein [Aeromicrobium sp.]MBC7633340.1 hypothetical protein [Aeromicrobium sp.]
MIESPGLPAYPPARNAWDYPPPPVSHGWKWVAIAAAVLSLLAAVALASTAYIAGTHDNPGLIQDQRMLDVIGRECLIMTATVDSMPVFGPPRQQAAILEDQDAAVLTMVEAIRKARDRTGSDDRPITQWLNDWERLVGARETLAEALQTSPTSNLYIPADESGNPIDERMNDALILSECVVPHALVDPYIAEETTV